MAGPNTTGVSNTGDLWLGRGQLFVSTLDANGLPLKWRHMGNAPAVSLTPSSETIQHFSSMTGLKNLDLETILQNTVSLGFTLDEINHENLALFLSGSKASVTNGSVTGFAEYLMVADGSMNAGRWYEIKNAAGVRCYDIDSADLTVKTNEVAPNTLVEGVDYDLNAEMGMIFMRSDSTDVTDAEALVVGLLVTLAANAGANAVNEVRALTQTSQIVAIKFIGVNAINGDKVEVQFHKVRLKAAGDFAQIGDDWSALSFEGGIEPNATASPDSPYFNLRTIGDKGPELIEILWFSSSEILILVFDRPFVGLIPDETEAGDAAFRFRITDGEFRSNSTFLPTQTGFDGSDTTRWLVTYDSPISNGMLNSVSDSLTTGTANAAFDADNLKLRASDTLRFPLDVEGFPVIEL